MPTCKKFTWYYFKNMHNLRYICIIFKMFKILKLSFESFYGKI